MTPSLMFFAINISTMNCKTIYIFIYIRIKMNYNKAILKTLAKDLESMGCKKEAARIKGKFNKQAEDSAAKHFAMEITSLQSRLKDLVKAFEFYPVGSGQFPDKDELALFYCGDDFGAVNSVIAECKKSELTFQSVQTLDFFKMTDAGSHSTALETLDEPCYVITCTVPSLGDKL